MNLILARIDDLRNKKGWSKYELAKCLGVSTNAVYAWYRTGAMPSLSNIERLCEALNITLEQFFCENGAYKLTEEEDRLLQEWMILSEIEKQAVFKMLDGFKVLRT